MIPLSGKETLGLRTERLTKRFPGILACDDISFEVKPGQALAVIGENGAGKTTLMNMLIGLYTPTEGRLYLNGKETAFACPEDALLSGIGMVHQQYMLVPDMTVCENIALGMQKVIKNASKDFKSRFSHFMRMDMNYVRERIADISAEYGLNVDPDAYIWQLSVGEQQRVELVKTLCIGARLLILDEPTSALTPQETGELIDLLKRMSGSLTLIFISHKLAEVKALCDSMIVLRSGKLVFSGKTADYSAADIAEMMTGHAVNTTLNCPAQHIGKDALVIDHLTALGDRKNIALDQLCLTIRSGEIVGLAGVSGNGQRELAEVLAGLRRAKSGAVTLYGESLLGKSPRQIIDMGMGYIPEERNIEGIVPSFSVKENLILKDAGTERFLKHGMMDQKAICDNADELCRAFDVRTSSIDVNAGTLSGGNIQKVILAREISRKPKFLVAVYPIRGLDLGATEFIHRQLLALRDSGAGILLISEEMDEIMSMADRIAVIFKGSIHQVLDKSEATPRKIGLLMAGVKEYE